MRVSVERPDFDADVNVVGTLARARGRAASTGRRSCSARRAARSTASATRPARRRITRARRSRPTASRSSRARSTSRRTTASTATSHVSLRFGNVYGPRQDPHGEAGVVAIFMNRLRDGGTPRIFGDGTQTRDYVYVGDVVAATLAAAEHDGGVFNVGTGNETSVLELYERIQRVSGVERDRSSRSGASGELQRSVLDPSPRTARARLAGRALARRRARRHVGLDLGGHVLGTVPRTCPRRRRRRLRHELAPGDGARRTISIRPWRRATIAVSAVAAVELVAARPRSRSSSSAIRSPTTSASRRRRRAAAPAKQTARAGEEGRPRPATRPQ